MDSQTEVQHDPETAEVQAIYHSLDKLATSGIYGSQSETGLKRINLAVTATLTDLLVQTNLPVSNVIVICPNCKKTARIGYKITGNKKARICKKCGKEL